MSSLQLFWRPTIDEYLQFIQEIVANKLVLNAMAVLRIHEKICSMVTKNCKCGSKWGAVEDQSSDGDLTHPFNYILWATVIHTGPSEFFEAVRLGLYEYMTKMFPNSSRHIFFGCNINEVYLQKCWSNKTGNSERICWRNSIAKHSRSSRCFLNHPIHCWSLSCGDQATIGFSTE